MDERKSQRYPVLDDFCSSVFAERFSFLPGNGTLAHIPLALHSDPDSTVLTDLLFTILDDNSVISGLYLRNAVCNLRNACT